MKDIGRKLNVARRMPRGLLMTILLTAMRRRLRRHFVTMVPTRLSASRVAKTAYVLPYDDLPPFLLDPDNRDRIVEAITCSYAEAAGRTISDANEVCRHKFALLGSGKTDLGPRIDWHRDFKSGFRWNHRAYYLWTRKHVTLNDDSDVKVPWELSRFQHLPTLGKAYWLTGDAKYAREFADEIESWISDNPRELGVNWACTMDVAIRAVNWIWGWYFFSNAETITEAWKDRFLKSLFLHGRHIRNNLEFEPIRGNHYLSDLAGLVYLGLFFNGAKEPEKWLALGVSSICQEMEGQVCCDGVDYEGSISYHRLVTELFLSATLLCLKNGTSFPDWYLGRLERMIDFVMYYTKPDGTAPQIGDNDDGRLHILADYGDWNRLDHRHLLSVGAVLFNRPDFKQAAGAFHEESLWLLGEDGRKRFDELPETRTSPSSKAFPQGGFYIMRSDTRYMIVDCVPASPGLPSGHKHNSRLSFELFAYDKSFIIDPGSFIYTADRNMRNLFRSTRYHNTVVVDDQEQNVFSQHELFNMGNDAIVRANRWEAGEEYDLLDAEHHGYARLEKPVVHRRQVLFDKKEGYWLIKDTLSGEGSHHFDVCFHFAPLQLEAAGEFPMMIRTKAEGANLAVIPLETEGLTVEILPGWVSYRYGVKVEAPVVRYHRQSEVPARFETLLYPYTGDPDLRAIMSKMRDRKAWPRWEGEP